MNVTSVLDDDVVRIHLDRPERLNALTAGTVEELVDALERAATRAQVVVVAGRGRAFCAGHDLREPVPVETAAQTRRRVERLHDLTRRTQSFSGIVVAAVHGYALGAGAELALACDLVIADADAQFGFPEVGVGLSVTGGISALLPKVVGPARAKEMLLLGERFGAVRAHELGLVNRVVPAGTHEQAAVELARRVAEQPRLSTSLAKTVIDRGLDATLEQAMATETEHALLTSLSAEGEAAREAFSRD